MARALDLGCGPGLNAGRLLESGWTVTAVDYHQKAIDACREHLGKNSEKLTLKKMDITTYVLGQERYELVLCVEVLQYIASSRLRSVLEKIHAALVPNGTFIGSLWFSSPGSEEFAKFSMNKARVYFYPGSSTVPAILEASGFRLEKCSFKALPRKKSTDPKVPICVEFVATKVAK